MIFGRTKELESVVGAAVERAYKQASDAVRQSLENGNSIRVLKEEIAKLEIERDKKKEEFDRREREVEHKVGLERKRQAFEIEQAKRETEVKVREENLKADKERFKSEMEFQRARLEGEVESLRKLVAQMMERLPSAEIIASFGKGGK